ncbi:hypothetical protein VKT23_013514 [Stygiomarasmius scandens]|uniref:F-box domain-containing protein n=1 Tax=Marasmiellus scandens TaxID=2682957 RepID=A0ABR1J7T0_9AGAR
MSPTSGSQLEISEILKNPQSTVLDLPPELEREIFELTAKTYRGTAVKLALVARKTQVWMERLLYHSIILDSAEQIRRFLCTIAARPAAFFAEYVKRLYLTTWVELDTTLRLLSVCTGITHLTSWAGPETPTPKEPLPVNHHTRPTSLLSALSLRTSYSYSSLQRMSMKLEALVVNIQPVVSHTSVLTNITNTLLSPHGSIARPSTPTIDFSHPIFLQLTHLDVVCPPFFSLTTFRSTFSPNKIPITHHATPYSARSPNPLTFRVDWNGIFKLPKLRHLSFGDLYNPAPAWIEDHAIRRDIEANHAYLTYLLPFFLERCEKLETLVVITNEDEVLDDIDEAFEAFERFTQASRTSRSAAYIESNPFRFSEQDREEKRGAKWDPRLVVVSEFHPCKSLPEYWDGVRWGGADFWNLTEGMAKTQKHSHI